MVWPKRGSVLSILAMGNLVWGVQEWSLMKESTIGEGRVTDSYQDDSSNWLDR